MATIQPPKMDTVIIIGTGLIGCSIAEGLRDVAGEIIGVDNDAGNLQEALSLGLIDRSMSLEKAAGHGGTIIVAVPVDASIELLPGLLSNVPAGSVVIDAGSVKEAICNVVKDHPNRQQFVAAHPMAGLAVSGPAASDAGLFRNRKVVICEREKSSGRALETASMIFTRLGMEIIYMEPGKHDKSVALVSHLPQLMAYCLSALVREKDDRDLSLAKIASTGFESSTRLASSPVNMWIPIFRHNSEKLSRSINDMIKLLAETEELIRQERWEEIGQLIERANRSRDDFLSRYRQL